jgi:hypothetical protein
MLLLLVRILDFAVFADRGNKAARPAFMENDTKGLEFLVFSGDDERAMVIFSRDLKVRVLYQP